MILRALFRLLTLAALAVAGWWIARMLGGARGRKRPRSSRPEVTEGAMVRDRICNTFLPRARAIETTVGDETHYFCSEECRSRFLQASGAARTA